MDISKMMGTLGDIPKELTGGAGVIDMLNQAEKYHITETVGAKEGDAFDETESIIEAEPEVEGVIVRCAYIVDGIQMLYKGNRQGQFYGNATGGGEHIIRFQEGDSLAYMEVNCTVPYGGAGGAISNLVIKTRKGKSYGPYGYGRNGSVLRLNIPETGEFKGVCGYTGKDNGYLAGIGLIYKQDKSEGKED